MPVSSVADMTTSCRSGRDGFLDAEGAGEGDVAVEMAFVELVEEDRRHPTQQWVAEHLAQQDALGDVLDAGARAGDVVEADAVADLLTPTRCHALARDAGGEHPGGQPAGLEDDDAFPRSPSRPASRSICGTCVDLPEPVGAWRMRRRLPAGSRNAAISSVGQFIDG